MKKKDSKDSVFISGALSSTEDMIRLRMLYSQADPQKIIRRYTAAVASNFVAWLGMTIPWVRHEASQHALVDNLRCELSEDHTSMLLSFAEACRALPETEDYRHVAKWLASVRALFRDPVSAGLGGLALVATLEHTSRLFIPDLKVQALSCGCPDFTYTDCHGGADAKHASDLVLALESEMGMGYHREGDKVIEGILAAGNLISCIYE